MRWPWSKPRVLNAEPKRWPKKVYFLDGPMAGKTAQAVAPGYEVVIPFIGHETGVPIRDTLEWEFPGFLMTVQPSYRTWRYAWDTLYHNGLVAYVRFVA